MIIKNFYDEETGTLSYIIADEETKNCAIIDSILNFNITDEKIFTNSADEIINYVEKNNYNVEWILETHIHADHLTAASYLKTKFPLAKVGIGAKITEILKFWAKFFKLENQIPLDGSQFDRLFENGEKFKIGRLEVEIIDSEGHTPNCTTYKIGENLFVGDAIFMPDVGSPRCDFPGGDAEKSYYSMKKILSFPSNYKIYFGHDYPTENRLEPQAFSTVKEENEKNILINKKVSKAEFLQERKKRDTDKPAPKLLYQSLRFNINSGKTKNYGK